MKKIIEGSLYNTATAKLVGEWDNRLGRRDFNYIEESLYLTKSGKYFLHGEGGGNSRYGEWHGNTGGAGEQIMPLEFDEARQWAENKLEVDEYEQIFGEVEEASDERLPRTFTLSVQAIGKLDRIKQESGESYGSILDRLILAE